MFTSMVDETTFEIQGKEFRVGDTIELSEEERTMLTEIQRLDKLKIEHQQNLINMIHQTDKSIVPELREPAFEVSSISVELSYLINKIMFVVQKRIGGKLPLDFKDRYENIIVRAKSPGEYLNFTVSSVKQLLNFYQFEDACDIASAIVEDRSKVKFNLDLNKKHGFQPVTCEFGTPLFDTVANVLVQHYKGRPAAPDVLFVFDTVDGVSYAMTVDNRQPQRVAKIVQFFKSMKPKAFFITNKTPLKDSFEVKVGYIAKVPDKDKITKTGIISVSLAPGEASIGDVKDTFSVPGGEVYAAEL